MTSWPNTVLIYTDGASRGNPGPCSFGLVAFDLNKVSENLLVLKKMPDEEKAKKIFYKESFYLEDKNTNNFAEYKAVIRALELSVQNQVKELYLFSDSEFLILQLKKIYKVRSQNIKPLFETCQKLLKKIPKTDFQHIPREQNKLADSLANKALDEKERDI